jgi:hypothetical protein
MKHYRRDPDEHGGGFHQRADKDSEGSHAISC